MSVEIKMRLAKLFLAGLLGLGSCYMPPRDLGLPKRYSNLRSSPYIKWKDEKNDITYFTLDYTKNNIEEIKSLIPKLMEMVEASEGKRQTPLEVIVLGKRDYRQLEKNSYLSEKSRGFYDIGDKCIVLKDYSESFTEREQRTFVHEYIHFIDLQDGKMDLSEEKVYEKERELSKRLGLD